MSSKKKKKERNQQKNTTCLCNTILDTSWHLMDWRTMCPTNASLCLFVLCGLPNVSILRNVNHSLLFFINSLRSLICKQAIILGKINRCCLLTSCVTIGIMGRSTPTEEMGKKRTVMIREKGQMDKHFHYSLRLKNKSFLPGSLILWCYGFTEINNLPLYWETCYFIEKKLKISVFSQRKRRFNLFRHVDTPKFCNLVTPREVSQNL